MQSQLHPAKAESCGRNSQPAKDGRFVSIVKGLLRSRPGATTRPWWFHGEESQPGNVPFLSKRALCLSS
jgi:hypothetical protein